MALSGLTDLVDGTLARHRQGGPSQLGAALDPVCDGVFFGAVAIGLAAGGAYPAFVAGVIVARYLLPVVVGGALVLAGWLPRLQHTVFGQVSTAVIACYLGGVALWRVLGFGAGDWALVGFSVIPLVTLLAWVDLARAGVRLARPR